MALLLLLCVLALAAAVAVGVAVARRSPPSAETTVAAARRHARVGSTAALTAGGAAAVWVGVRGGDLDGGPGSSGVAVMLAPVAFGVVHTLVLAVAELTWPRPQGEVRRARLVRRGLLDAAPRWLVRATATATVLLATVLSLGALLADPDGRGISHRPSPDVLTSAGPFPGAFYGRPALAGVLVLAAAVVVTLRIVATRPAVVTADDRIEAALRRASVHRVLRGAAAAVLVLTGGLLLFGGGAVRSLGQYQHVGGFAVVGTAVVVLGLVTALSGVVVAAVRAPGVPADHPVAA